jgi:signal recognition particle subunit SRP54
VIARASVLSAGDRMFDRISDTLNGAFRKLSGRGTISEANVRDAMDEVRTSLLEADVHIEVVDEFVDSVLKDAVGAKVTDSLKPGQEMIGIVNRRLVELLGGDPEASPEAQMAAPEEIMVVKPGPTVVMMCGLQGSGKTTTCGKLAMRLRAQGRSVMVAAGDLQRPAAVEQLQTVAAQAGAGDGPAVTCYAEMDKVAEYGKAVGAAVDVCRKAVEKARTDGVDVVILDTAGRLHINDDLMGELDAVRRNTNPHHIFLVVDAMTGQDAVNSAKAFNERLTIDGVIMTKFDSDTRGGAALSVKKVTGARLRYIGTGEKLADLEAFVPERMAGRILGMGDVLSLVEKAQAQVSEEEAAELEAKMAKGDMDMNDFLKQLGHLKRMGSMKQLMGLLPGLGSLMKNVELDDKQFDRVEAMINSMTLEERKTPKVIVPSRRRRIGIGSGVDQNEVGQLVKQFDMINKMSKSMATMGPRGRADAVKQMQAAGGMGGLMPDLPMMKTKRSTASQGRGAKGFKKRKKR